MKRDQTVTEAAEVLGCHEQTIRRRCNEADKSKRCPHTRLRNGQLRVNAEELAAWGRDNNCNWRPGRPADTPDSPDLEAARLRKENALASKYELQVQREKSVLVPAEDVRARWVELVTTAKSKLLGLGAGVAPQCEGHDAGTIQGIIESRVNEILVDLSA